MSIERPDENPARRRPPALIGAVVAAVVLAGGGGAWWAATADGGGGGKNTAAAPVSPTPTPTPLSISGPADRTDPPAQGIAPGEPAPTGVIYLAGGELPEGPATAQVRRTAATVSLADATRLARAFGMPGTPASQGGYWRLGADGPEPHLEVSRTAPGTWTYLRGTGGLSPCPSDSVCADGPSGTSPVSPGAARAAARPVLDSLGLGDAALTDGGLLGALRVVGADPVVDGLPTHGWSTDVRVGPDGAVAGASGRLVLPGAQDRDAAYPVVGARAALAALNAAQGAATAPACATAVPLDGGDGGPKTAGPECVPSSGRTAPPTPMTVEKAVFGLSAQSVDDAPALVPSWLFTVRPEAGGAVSTVAQVAVAPAYLEAPSASRPARGVTPLSYTEHGRTLEVAFWGGVCGTYSASAEEDRTEVRVTITEPRPEPGTACVAMAERVTVPVALDAPLAGRTVLETASGKPIPRG
ncbi:hypothetical protein [Streptomyces sp. NPDC060198]|uniref:hypothetical protein n=1 Tax=Streptomyces sp. NPDC060198 TaxID=3347070 RepID=UPI00365F2EA5